MIKEFLTPTFYDFLTNIPNDIRKQLSGKTIKDLAALYPMINLKQTDNVQTKIKSISAQKSNINTVYDLIILIKVKRYSEEVSDENIKLVCLASLKWGLPLLGLESEILKKGENRKEKSQIQSNITQQTQKDTTKTTQSTQQTPQTQPSTTKLSKPIILENTSTIRNIETIPQINNDIMKQLLSFDPPKSSKSNFIQVARLYNSKLPDSDITTLTRQLASKKNAITSYNLLYSTLAKYIKDPDELLILTKTYIHQWKKEHFTQSGGGVEYGFKIPRNVKKFAKKGNKYAKKFKCTSYLMGEILVDLDYLIPSLMKDMKRWFKKHMYIKSNYDRWLKTKKTQNKKEIVEWLLHGGNDGMKWALGK